MALLFYSPDEDAQAWRRALLHRLPDLDFRAWPDTGDLAEIDAALVWRVPPGLLRTLPNLKAVLSLGAGVDAMLADPTLPELPLCRLIDRSLTRMMSEFVLAAGAEIPSRAGRVRGAAAAGRVAVPAAAGAGGDPRGHPGPGRAGGRCRPHVAQPWLRGPRLEPLEKTAARNRLLTPVRRNSPSSWVRPTSWSACCRSRPIRWGILDARLFAQLPRGARLINVARGAHLVEPDLLDALESGQLAHASLDVLRARSRCRPAHPFWRHPRIDLTPHVASFSEPEIAADGVAENLRRLRDGRPLLQRGRPARGY